MMQCSACRNKAIIFQPYSGRNLCRDHFIADLESKAKRSIRVHQWMQPKDHIAVALTGGSAGNALLFFFRKLTGKRKDIRISAVTVEGVAGNLDMIQDPDITKIAVATTLEENAASALTSILRGRVEKITVPARATGRCLPLITPFSHIPAEEIAAYAGIHGLADGGVACPEENDPLFCDVKSMLAGYSRRHPAASHAVLNLSESLAGSYSDAGAGAF